MSLPKHTLPTTATQPATKRAKQTTVGIDIPSQLKGTSFKFKARPNQDGDFQAWLFDVTVTAFPTAAGKKDEIVLDVMVGDKNEKKKKPFDFAKVMAAMRSGDMSALDDDEDDADDEEDDGHYDEEDDYDGLDEEEDDIPNAIGSVFARIVHRHRIRTTFWRSMEEPSPDTCE